MESDVYSGVTSYSLPHYNQTWYVVLLRMKRNVYISCLYKTLYDNVVFVLTKLGLYNFILYRVVLRRHYISLK